MDAVRVLLFFDIIRKRRCKKIPFFREGKPTCGVIGLFIPLKAAFRTRSILHLNTLLMNRFLPAFGKALVWIVVSICSIRSASAQKGQPSIVTLEMANRVAEIVKPLKEQSDRILKEDPSGQFKAYQADLKKMSGLKLLADRSVMAQKIRERYAKFFAEVWSSMKVDEKMYQEKIRAAFPAAVSERIRFKPYLNFSISITENTAPPPPTPAAEPMPENKCVDVCAIAAGEMNGSTGLIAGGAGSYGNCFIRTSSWGAAAGGNNIYGALKNNCTIPGTFPVDSRKLRVKKSYELKQEVNSFAVLGFGYAETRVTTHQTSAYLFVMSPVIFGAGESVAKTVNEEYVLEKADVARSVIRSSSNTFAYFISGNWCFSECNGIRWSICEEK